MDYLAPSCVTSVCDDAGPSIEALSNGDLHGFFAKQPPMGSFSMLVRTPPAMVSNLVGGNDLLVYRSGVFVCLLAAGLLGVFLAMSMMRRGPSVDHLGARRGRLRDQPAHLPGRLLGPPRGGARRRAGRGRRDRVGPAPLADRRADAGRRAGDQAVGRARGPARADRRAGGHARAPRGHLRGADGRAGRADAGRATRGASTPRRTWSASGAATPTPSRPRTPGGRSRRPPSARGSTGSVRRRRSRSTRCRTASGGSCITA